MNAVITRAEADQAVEVQSGDSRTIMSLIERLATNPEIDLARIEKLLELKERWDAGEARKAYVAAMAAFKADPPTIIKDKHVKFQTSRGVTEYDHATLGALCDAIVKGLSKHAISHRWDVKQTEGRVQVTCILTHALGHSESVSMNGPIDDSGGKNAIQAISSSVTYLERYTLFAATGLAAQEDDDGRSAGPTPETITEKQAADLQALITEDGGNLQAALRYMKVEKLTDIPAANFESVVKDIKSINARRAADRARK